MEFPVKAAAPVAQRTACAILPLFEDGRLPEVTAAFDKASQGRIRKLLRAGEVSARLGSTQIVHQLPGSAAQRVLLVGCGRRSEYGRKQLSRAVFAAGTAIRQGALREAINYLTLEPPSDADVYYSARLSVQAILASVYSFDELKSSSRSRGRLNRVGIAITDRAGVADVRRGIRDGTAIARGVETARNLGNRPANVCTPTHMAHVAEEIAQRSAKLSVKVLREQRLRSLGMGAFLSVTQGAAEPAMMIVMEYKGGPRGDAPIALCGKGVTFDTGGISLKPPPKMDEMKFDMCGAAAVIGTMAAIAELAPPINVVAIVPACENMPSDKATRPGDIVTSMSGKTIEILNTDAEGRLILCDALTYAQRTYSPSRILDVATLTGACVIALGPVHTGIFANSDDLSEELVDAGKRSVDSAWPMPVDAEYGESLKSNFADFANVGNREGGASVAAAFLSKFIEDGRPWAHLDIAGVAWLATKNKGATGRPVSLLVDFLLHDNQA